MNPDKVIVIFTEGETDEVFYKRLYQYIRKNVQIKAKIIIKNLKGIGRYEQKAPAKLKYEIINKYPESQIIVFCSYDLDVFQRFQEKPPTDWKKVEQKLRNAGANEVFHIKANKMIEDWFLYDVEGLCKFLKIKMPKKIAGRTAFEKIKTLFKKGNKIYQKGYNTDNFVELLDIEKIYKSIENELKELVKQMKE